LRLSRCIGIKRGVFEKVLKNHNYQEIALLEILYFFLHVTLHVSGSDWLYVFYTYPYLTSIMLDDEMVSWSTDSIVGAIKRLA